MATTQPQGQEADISSSVTQDVPQRGPGRPKKEHIQDSPEWKTAVSTSKAQMDDIIGNNMREDVLANLDEYASRKQFALEAFKILVQHHVDSKSYAGNTEIIGDWSWKLADAAMRGSKVQHKPSVIARGVQVVAPVADSEPLPDLPPEFDPAKALAATQPK